VRSPNLILASWICLSAVVAGCSRPAQTAAAPPPPPPFEYVDAWGIHGDGPGQFDKPVAITCDDESIIYIADAATGFINKFSSSGEPRLSFQDDRSNLRPADIAVDAGSAIYVADARRATVAIFFSDGVRHRELRTNALSAERESLHIAVDAYGTIYVTAKHPYGIRKFTPGLRPSGSWGGGAAKKAPVSAPIDNPTALAVGPDGLVYISELAQPEIKVYDAAGTPQRTVVVPTDTDPHLTGIAVNRKFIFAVGTSYPSIYVWSLDGSFQFMQDLSAWVPGVGSNIVRKIVVTPAGELLLLDTAAARVFRFRLHLQ
jgi:hypothetical protein